MLNDTKVGLMELAKAVGTCGQYRSCHFEKALRAMGAAFANNRRVTTSHQNLSKFTRNPKDFVRRIIALRSIKTTELKKTPRSS